jgi:hypothetical protein
MVTGMDSLVAHQRRGEVAREVDSGRLDRRLRKSDRPGRERRWAFWLLRESGAPADTPAAPKIRHLRDATVPTRS